MLTFGHCRVFRVSEQKQKGDLHTTFYIIFLLERCRFYPPKWAVMADQIVITEKSSQAKDVRAAVGSRYGDKLAADPFET